MTLDAELFLKITIYKKDKVVSKKKERKIAEKLNKGLLYFGLESGQITDTDFNVKYTVDFTVESNEPYKFYCDE